MEPARRKRTSRFVCVPAWRKFCVVSTRRRRRRQWCDQFKPEKMQTEEERSEKRELVAGDEQRHVAVKLTMFFFLFQTRHITGTGHPLTDFAVRMPFSLTSTRIPLPSSSILNRGKFHRIFFFYFFVSIFFPSTNRVVVDVFLARAFFPLGLDVKRIVDENRQSFSSFPLFSSQNFRHFFRPISPGNISIFVKKKRQTDWLRERKKYRNDRAHWRNHPERRTWWWKGQDDYLEGIVTKEFSKHIEMGSKSVGGRSRTTGPCGGSERILAIMCLAPFL